MTLKQFDILTKEDVEEFFAYLFLDLKFPYNPNNSAMEFLNLGLSELKIPTKMAEEIQVTMEECVEWCEANYTDIDDIAEFVFEVVSKPVNFQMNSLDLNGKDLNAYSLMKQWENDAKAAGWQPKFIKDVLEMAMDSDLGQLITLLRRFSKNGIFIQV